MPVFAANNNTYPTSPKEVIEDLLRNDYDPEVHEWTGVRNDRDKYFVEYRDPGSDCYEIATKYNISIIESKKDKCIIKATYSILGSICGWDMLIVEKKTEVRDYELMSVGGKWKIKFGHEPPIISINTAIRMFEKGINMAHELNDKNAIRKHIEYLINLNP